MTDDQNPQIPPQPTPPSEEPPAPSAPTNPPEVAGSVDEPVSTQGARAAGETAGMHEGAAVGGPEPQRTRWWLIAAVIAGALLIILAVWLLTKNRITPKEVANIPVTPVATATAPTQPKTPTVAAPNVVGQSQASAQAAIQAAGLFPLAETVTTSVSPAGTVVAQIPSAGTNVYVGSQIAIEVAQAATPPKPTNVTVPNVVGMSQAAAQTALTNAGLAPAFVIEPSSATKGNAVAQQPVAGSAVAPGTAVVVAVSSGAAPAPATVAVPKVTGLTQASALSALSSAGLGSQVVQSFSTSAAKGTVFQQWPPAGSKVAPGTPVAVVVSEGAPPSGNTLVAVPSIVGLDANTAAQTVASAGLVPEQVTIADPNEPEGKVVGQLPTTGSMVPPGTQVLIGVAGPAPVQH